jgi:hypothetical protein
LFPFPSVSLVGSPAERLWKWHRDGGQVVLVTIEPTGADSRIRSVYFVVEQDPETAKAVIGPMMAPNEKVEARGAGFQRQQSD